MNENFKSAMHELKHHSPFTFLSSLLAIVFAIFVHQFFPESNQIALSTTFFETLHPVHLFVSAIATSAMFSKYKNGFAQAFVAGIFGAFFLGTFSDIIFPYLGALIFNLNPEFHFPLISSPLIISSSLIIGSIVGVKTKLTKLPHFTHVLLSVFASLFYLFAFSNITSFISGIFAFIVIFIAVIIPCCLSDILFPFIFLGECIKKCGC